MAAATWLPASGDGDGFTAVALVGATGTVGEIAACAAAGVGAGADAAACAGNARERCAVTAMPPANSTTPIAMTARPAAFKKANCPSRRTSLSTRHFQTGAADAPTPT